MVRFNCIGVEGCIAIDLGHAEDEGCFLVRFSCIRDQGHFIVGFDCETLYGGI